MSPHPQPSITNPRIDVRYVAHLARLELTDAEMEKFSKQLGDILGHIEQLKKLNVEGIEPTFVGVEISLSLREDKVKRSLPVSEAIKNAPKKANNLFIVPKIVE